MPDDLSPKRKLTFALANLLLKDGLTYRQIGALYGISGPAAYNVANPEKSREFYQQNAERIRRNRRVRYHNRKKAS